MDALGTARIFMRSPLCQPLFTAYFDRKTPICVSRALICVMSQGAENDLKALFPVSVIRSCTLHQCTVRRFRSVKYA